MSEHLASPIAHSVTLALVHFLWQGVLVGLIYWLITAAFDTKSARTRYATSLVALLAMSICPLVTFVTNYGARSTSPASEVAGVDATAIETDSISRPHAPVVTSETVPGQPVVPRDEVSLRASSSPQTIIATQSWFATIVEASQPSLLLAWLAGVLLSGARMTGGLINIVWLRSGQIEVTRELAEYSLTLARRLRVGTARVFASERVRVAAVVGFVKPVVLLPASWLTELPPDVLQAVIAHEFAHIRRFDVWANLLQRLLETLLFYHPMVWWLSNRIRFERELCCDELAVEATGDRGKYVIALEQVGCLEVRGTPALTPAILGDRKMGLLNRVQHILGTGKPQREPSWLVGLVAVASLLIVGTAVGVFSDSNPAVAQDREGGRSAEAEAGPRRSAEGDGQRRSAEGEAGPRRSAEGEAGPRRSAEGDAGARRSAEGERGSGERRAEGRDALEALRGFKPQTERETTLFQMILQLQREVAALRQEVRGRRDGEADRRDGRTSYGGTVSRDGDAAGSGFANFKLPPNWQRTKEGRVFLAYDKNRDEIVSLEEWLAMTNGNISAARREIGTKHFNDAEPSGDGKFTPAEFIWWRQIGSKQAAERIRQNRSRDGESGARGPRDGEGERRGPRDGEAGERGPRDGEGERRGPRDGDRE